MKICILNDFQLLFMINDDIRNGHSPIDDDNFHNAFLSNLFQYIASQLNF